MGSEGRHLPNHFNEPNSTLCLEKKRSETWRVEVGVIQGGILSPDLYNIATITQPIWCSDVSESMTYADDGGHVVADPTEKGCIEKAELVCKRMAAWYDKVGLTMNARKTEEKGSLHLECLHK